MPRKNRPQSAVNARLSLIRSLVGRVAESVPCDEVALRTAFLVHRQRALAAELPAHPRKRR